MWSFTFYIVHTCTITIKIVVFVYNHNYLYDYLYEDVMPAFPTYFFLFHVTFGMLFLLIFCILTEVEFKLYNLFPQLLEILGIHCNENNIKFLRYLIIHIHTYIVRYAYKYTCIRSIQHGTEIQAMHIHINPYKTQNRSPTQKAMKIFYTNKYN